MERVTRDMQKNLKQLVRVPRNLRKVGRQIYLQLNMVRAELWLMELDRRLYDRVQIDGNLLSGNLAREVQETGDQDSRPPHLLRNFRSQRSLFLRQPRFGQQFRI